MMSSKSVALVLVAVSGCAAAPPSELIAARTAYDAAARGPAAQLDPADLNTAKETLRAANQSYEDGDAREAADIAYVAERRAEVATARADAMSSLRQRDAVLAQSNADQTSQVQLTSAELKRANEQLAVQGQALDSARQRAKDADDRAAKAAADLARIASVKRDARGMVITLSGSVLFRSGQSDMLPGARTKMNEVADALKQQGNDAKIVVQGYTDSRGSDSLNQALSQRRAETVRNYLATRGVEGDRVTAQGMGASDPIADNASAEGRADNRRVEIVVQNHP